MLKFTGPRTTGTGTATTLILITIVSFFTLWLMAIVPLRRHGQPASVSFLF
jgi:hypothetical protein